MNRRHAYRPGRDLPKVPLQAAVLVAFAGMCFFEVSVGSWIDFLLGLIYAVLLMFAWVLATEKRANKDER